MESQISSIKIRVQKKSNFFYCFKPIQKIYWLLRKYQKSKCNWEKALYHVNIHSKTEDWKIFSQILFELLTKNIWKHQKQKSTVSSIKLSNSNFKHKLIVQIIQYLDWVELFASCDALWNNSSFSSLSRLTFPKFLHELICFVLLCYVVLIWTIPLLLKQAEIIPFLLIFLPSKAIDSIVCVRF